MCSPIPNQNRIKAPKFVTALCHARCPMRLQLSLKSRRRDACLQPHQLSKLRNLWSTRKSRQRKSAQKIRYFGKRVGSGEGGPKVTVLRFELLRSCLTLRDVVCIHVHGGNPYGNPTPSK